MSGNKYYIAIDLKSFYASVECVERGLDPLTTNLLVADISRTDKTVCLAVSPSLKSYGISGRARLFEAKQKIKEANERRRKNNHGVDFRGKSSDANLLGSDNSLSIDYIAAPPRMSLYIEYSTRIYEVYLKHVAPEDIHVYSIDEVFIDATPYLKTRGLDASEFALTIVKDVFMSTGITATAGIGTNLYLCKVAMDILAKRAEPDENGARIAALDEMSYRRLLWNHRPLTDFWRVGKGYAEKLESKGIYTMGDVAKCSVGSPRDFYNEELLYRMFGVSAELLIDHAWGYEPCTVADIKAYRPKSNSISSGQVLPIPYEFENAKLVLCEMADTLALELVKKELLTAKIVITVGYDSKNLSGCEDDGGFGDIVSDGYGRKLPKPAHGTVNIDRYTSSSKLIIKAASELFERIVDKRLLIRRLNITADRVVSEAVMEELSADEQLSLFVDYEDLERKRQKIARESEREKNIQKTLIDIRKKHGKNAVLKGMNLLEGSTAKERNLRIGGHKA